MSHIDIHIDIDASSGCAGVEVARILRDLAELVKYEPLKGFGAMRPLNHGMEKFPMSYLDIHIDLDNDAFSGCAGVEVGRILRELADLVEYDSLEGFGTMRLLDLNGNSVGECMVHMDDPIDLTEQAWQARDKEFREFVFRMSREDIVTTLENACDIQCYDHESRRMLAETLVSSLHDGDTDLESLRYFFQGKY